MGLEFELKYKSEAAQQTAIAMAYADLSWTTVQMRTVYYDTPTGALSGRHMTLRCRLENGVPVCTVKTPAQAGRGEWELRGCDSVEKAIPALCDMGAPRELLTLTEEGLVELCGAQFTRRAATITWEGTQLELALDSGFLLAGEKKVPLCEVEVELKEGLQADTVAWATVLAHRFGLVPEKKSKFRRALDLRGTENG